MVGDKVTVGVAVGVGVAVSDPVAVGVGEVVRVAVGVRVGVWLGVGAAQNPENDWRGVPLIGLPFASWPLRCAPSLVHQEESEAGPAPVRSIVANDAAWPAGHGPPSPLAESSTFPEESYKKSDSPELDSAPV
jgi:hypothetical protein